MNERCCHKNHKKFFGVVFIALGTVLILGSALLLTDERQQYHMNRNITGLVVSIFIVLCGILLMRGKKNRKGGQPSVKERLSFAESERIREQLVYRKTFARTGEGAVLFLYALHWLF